MKIVFIFILVKKFYWNDGEFMAVASLPAKSNVVD
jgi:hypothetical protein